MDIKEELTVIYLISRNWRKFERGFINCVTDKCSSCYFPKFETEGSFPNFLKFFDSYFREVELVKKHFHFQKGFKFPRFEMEVEYFTVMPVVSNKWNI